MTYGHRRRRPGPYDRGTYPITVSQAQAAAGTVLHVGKMRLKGWSLASTGIISLQNHGSVVSPAAGATIVSVTGVPPGDYIVNWTVELAGTLAAADADNFQLFAHSALILSSDNLAVAGEYPQLSVVVSMAATGTVSVKANNLATVGAVYTADLTLTPLAAGAIGQLLDGGQLLGQVSTGADQVDTEFIGDDGLYVGTSIAVLATQGNLAGVVYVCDDPAEPDEEEPSQLSSLSQPPSSQPARP